MRRYVTVVFEPQQYNEDTQRDPLTRWVQYHALEYLFAFFRRIGRQDARGYLMSKPTACVAIDLLRLRFVAVGVVEPELGGNGWAIHRWFQMPTVPYVVRTRSALRLAQADVRSSGTEVHDEFRKQWVGTITNGVYRAIA